MDMMPYDGQVAAVPYVQIVQPAATTPTPSSQTKFLPGHIIDSSVILNKTGQCSKLSFDFMVNRLPANGELFYWAYYVLLTSGKGLYTGFQNNGNLVTKNGVGKTAHFAIWDAVKGFAGPQGEAGIFTGEGTGIKTPSRYDFKPGYTYTTTLTQSGDLITSTVLDKQSGVSTLIGTIQVRPGEKLSGGSGVAFTEIYNQVAMITPLTATFGNFEIDGVKGALHSPWGPRPVIVSNGVENLPVVSGDNISHFVGGTGNNSIYLPDADNTVWLGSKVETTLGGAGKDVVFRGNATNQAIDGGPGLDTVIYSSARSGHSLRKNQDGTLSVTGPYGTDLLKSIERLHFTDKKIAFDLSGNAGMVAKMLGAVFGKSYLTDRTTIGKWLKKVDEGLSYDELLKQGLDSVLGTQASHADVVNLLYTNVVGVAPSPADRDYFVGLLENGTYTVTSLARFAADIDLNLNNINFNGLVAYGLEYY